MMQSKCAPVWAFHRVEYEGAFLCASAGFPGRMSAEPIVGKTSVWCAVRQAVLKKIHSHSGHLPGTNDLASFQILYK